MQRPRNSVRKLTVALCAGAAFSLISSASAFSQGNRPDQVFVKGSTRQETGEITENSLSSVVLMRDGKEKRIDASRVDRIIWGAVCAPYREGKAYLDRNDYENAAAKFSLAATEDERKVMQAEARKLAGLSLLNLGAKDPSQFALALDEFKRFLDDYPDSRSVPEVRAYQARATWLRGGEGDVAAAGAMYRSLFEAGSGATPTAGYGRLNSFEAGLQAIRALTLAGDTLGAREIAGVLAGGIGNMQSEFEDGTKEKSRLNALAAEVQLAEGFVLLASNQARQAETFFNSQLQASADGPAALRYGSRLGLGQAYLEQGQLREASVEFATVASIDYTDRDRSARAMLLLCETMIKLGDSDGSTQARKRLNVIISAFGDTPSALAAKKLLESL